MRKRVLVASFFAVTPFLLIFSIVYSVLIRVHTHKSVLSATTNNIQPSKIIQNQSQLGKTQPQKSEVEQIYLFLIRYNSPLAPYSQNIVDESHTFGLDSRLLPAIAMTESTGCRNEPPGSHNCWGYGIYGHTVTSFANYPDAIHTVAKTLGQKYGGRGLMTPEQIMHIYTPSSPNGHWAYSVVQFMQQIN